MTEIALVTRWQAFDARLSEPGPIHVRRDLANGEKDVQWRTDNAYGLVGHRLPDLIYAERVPLPSHVVITEGEKAADAIRAAAAVNGRLEAVGTVCGAGARDVWSQAVVDLFAGVHVTLWPDRDDVGREHMGRVAGLLEPVVASMRLVDVPPDMPHGWDAADVGPATIRELVATAHDVWLRRP